MADALTIIRALGGNESSGMCRCPAHDDDRPSLHVSQGRNGAVVFCHAGCAQEAVIAVLRQRGLWHDGERRRRVTADHREEDGEHRRDDEHLRDARRIVRAASDDNRALRRYFDSRGIDEVPANARFLSAEKARQIDYDGHPLRKSSAMVFAIAGESAIQGAHVTWLSRDGEEKLPGNDARRTYGRVQGGYVQLAEIDRDTDMTEPLIVGEGIETVLSAMQISGHPGIAALNAANLKAVVLPEVARHIVVAVDNDPKGREAAYALAERLQYEGHQVTIAVPRHEGEDWNDVLVKDGEATARKEWQVSLQAPPTQTKAVTVLAEEEFMSASFPRRTRLIAPWLPSPGLAMIHAPRGEGKTWLALSAGKAVAARRDLLGWNVPRYAKVLYVDGELPGALLQERLAAFEPSPPGTFHILCRDSFERRGQAMPDLSDGEGRAALDRLIDSCGAELIILDSVSTLVRGGDENDAAAWAPIQHWLLTHRTAGRTVVLIAHDGRAKGHARGSSKREDVLDTVIGLRKRDDDTAQDESTFELTFGKTRDSFGDAAAAMMLRLSFRDGRINWRTEKVRDVIAEKVRELSADGMTQEKIAEELGVSQSTVSRALKAAKTSNVTPFPPRKRPGLVNER